jgi:hypothetical protein
MTFPILSKSMIGADRDANPQLTNNSDYVDLAGAAFRPSWSKVMVGRY